VAAAAEAPAKVVAAGVDLTGTRRAVAGVEKREVRPLRDEPGVLKNPPPFLEAVILGVALLPGATKVSLRSRPPGVDRREGVEGKGKGE